MKCFGWPGDTCGGANAMNVYVNDAVAATATPDDGSSSTSSDSQSLLTNSQQSMTASTTPAVIPDTTSAVSSSSTDDYSSTESSSDSQPASTGSMGTYHSDKVLAVAATTVPSKTPVITPTVDSATTSVTPTTTTSSSSSSTTPSSSSSSSLAVATTTTPPSSSSSSLQNPTTATVFSSSSTILTSLKYTTKIITASIETAVNHGPKTVFLTTKSVIETVAHTVIAVQSDDPNFDLNKKNSSNGGSPLSGGAIAGIVIGVIFGVIAILVLVVFLLLYKRKRAEEQRRIDLERTKQFQPYSFGDVNATPIILPPPSSSSLSASNWKLPSRNNTGLSSRTLALSFSNSNSNNNNNKYKSGTRGNINSDDFDFDADADFNFGSRGNSGSMRRKSNFPQSHTNSIASRRSAESFINNSNNYYYYSHVNRKFSTQSGFYGDNNNNNHRNSNGSSNVHAYGHIHDSAAERLYGGRRTSSGIRHPSTVFEEPTMSVYNGNERFSTSSLPDMMEQRRQLRIVNPDDGDGDSIEYLDGPSSPSDDNSYNEK